jgi:hypothetical protein
MTSAGAMTTNTLATSCIRTLENRFVTFFIISSARPNAAKP